VNNLKDLFNTNERTIAIAMLKRARKLLNPGMGEFVCCNLKTAADGLDFLYQDVVEILRKEIDVRIEGAGTVCSWLRGQGYTNDQILERDGWRMVEYRQAWIDSMIEELR
jgi:hypothetical protein